MTGANRRILFIPDMNNIKQINENFTKFQQFINNDIYSKYYTKKHKSINNNNTTNKTINYIFSRLSSSTSTSLLINKTSKTSKRIEIKDITSLYDDSEEKDNYLNKLRAQMYVHNCNKVNNNDTNISDGDIAALISQSQQRRENNLSIFQREIENIILHHHSISNAPAQYQTGLKNINFNKVNLRSNDVEIDYNIWRSKIARPKRFPSSLVHCNHYYYHTLPMETVIGSENIPEKLDYNIENDRILFDYPKLYNIDYDCVEKGFKYRLANYVTKLKEFERTHGPRNVHRHRYGRNLRYLRRRHGIERFDPNKDTYFALKEFYQDCNIQGQWISKFSQCGINRCVDNFEEYDLFDYSKKQIFTSNVNMSVLLIGNMDRMYNIKFNDMVKKWYKNGKYLLYAILPHEFYDELSLSIDFCHFEIYYNRLKLLQSVFIGQSDDNGDTNSSSRHNILSRYVCIALSDCSRYCKDELHRQDLFCAKAHRSFSSAKLKRLFINDKKAVWDRPNKYRYKYNYESNVY